MKNRKHRAYWVTGSLMVLTVLLFSQYQNCASPSNSAPATTVLVQASPSPSVNFLGVAYPATTDWAGRNNSLYQTLATITNSSSTSPTTVNLNLIQNGTVTTQTVTLAPGIAISSPNQDILRDVFGITAPTFGILTVTTVDPTLPVTTSFLGFDANQNPVQTFPTSSGIDFTLNINSNDPQYLSNSASSIGVFSNGANNQRSNVGIVNLCPGTNTSNFQVTYADGSGNAIGAPITIPLAPNNVFQYTIQNGTQNPPVRTETTQNINVTVAGDSTTGCHNFLSWGVNVDNTTNYGYFITPH